MPVTGRKPKPEDQRRNPNKPRYEWTEVDDVPFTTGPALPLLTPMRRRRRKPPEPPRALGPTGQDLWDRLADAAIDDADRSRLAMICESQDERAALRYRVLSGGDELRNCLRVLDAQLYSALNGWCERHTAPRLMAWPRETEEWWEALRSLPHAVLWGPSDWRYASDTAYLHAAVMNGDWRLGQELRNRERVIGTTADSRRDLRIRYVAPAVLDDVPPAGVTAMDSYRAALDE
jgi:hypothetical protein